MKKLLTILGTLALLGSTAGVAVSCGTSSTSTVDRWSTPDLALYNKIMMQINANDDLSAISESDFFKDVDFKTYVTSMLNNNVSYLYNNSSLNQLRTQLNMNTVESSDETTAISDILDEVATNQLYSDYTSSIISNGNARSKELEWRNGDGYIGVNPTHLMAKITDDDGNEKYSDNDGQYAIYFKSKDDDTDTYKQWIASFETYSSNTSGRKENLPTLDDMSDADFIIVYKKGAKDSSDMPETITPSTYFTTTDDATDLSDGECAVLSSDSSTAKILTGKEALQYRFEQYYKTQIKSSMSDNALTISYLKSQLYSTYNGNLYLNQSSAVSQKVQSWDKKTGYESSIKLVWSYTFDKNDYKSEYDNFKDLFNSNANGGNVNDANKYTSIVNLLTKSSGDNSTTLNEKNQSELGIDPYFGLKGFNGFVINDGDSSISSADGTLSVNDDAAKSAIRNATGPSIITGDKNEGYTVSGKSSLAEYYIVLPIYMVDLLNDQTGLYKDGADKVEITYKKQDDSYSVSNVTVNGEDKGTTIPDGANDLTANDFRFTDINVDDQGVYTFADIQKNNIGWLKSTDNDTLLDKLTNTSSIDSSKGPNEFTVVTYLNNDGTTSYTDNLLTFSGTTNSGDTTIDKNAKINLGYRGHENIYVKDSSMNYDFYNNNGSGNSNVTSTDIANLDSNVKEQILNELIYITSKDSDNLETAKTQIYRLFISEDQVLYQDLYDSISSYLKETQWDTGETD